MLAPITVRILLLICFSLVDAHDTVNSYARVAKLGSNMDSAGLSQDDNSGPKIYKALNMDLNIPSSTAQTVEEVTEDTSSESLSGRAYKYSGQFHGFPRRPYFVNRNQRPSATYPRYRPSYKRIDPAMDRFTPGEAVATSFFKKDKDGYNYNPPKMKPPRPGAGYIPPKSLYSFPPNIESNYMPPKSVPTVRPKKPITSYVPPPAGPSNLGFVGPVNPDYLPPFLQSAKPSSNMGKMKTSDKQESKPEMTTGSDDMLPPLDNGDSQPSGGGKDVPPASSDTSDSPPMDDDMSSNMDMPPMDEAPPDTDDDHPDHPDHLDHPDHPEHPDHEEHPDHPEHPHHPDIESDISDDHFPSFHGHSFYGSHGIDAYPEIEFDDHDHDHHHFHHTHPPEIMTTTTMKPEPPPEPRVKKYSYFYLGRKLWYIPLYFTVWFSFYIFWLIIKSIARHKVNLPNHYTGRMMKRSISEYLTSQDTIEDVNDLTSRIINYIEDFDRKYSKKE